MLDIIRDLLLGYDVFDKIPHESRIQLVHRLLPYAKYADADLDMLDEIRFLFRYELEKNRGLKKLIQSKPELDEHTKQLLSTLDDAKRAIFEKNGILLSQNPTHSLNEPFSASSSDSQLPQSTSVQSPSDPPTIIEPEPVQQTPIPAPQAPTPPSTPQQPASAPTQSQQQQTPVATHQPSTPPSRAQQPAPVATPPQQQQAPAPQSQPTPSSSSQLDATFEQTDRGTLITPLSNPLLARGLLTLLLQKFPGVYIFINGDQLEFVPVQKDQQPVTIYRGASKKPEEVQQQLLKSLALSEMQEDKVPTEPKQQEPSPPADSTPNYPPVQAPAPEPQQEAATSLESAAHQASLSSAETNSSSSAGGYGLYGFGSEDESQQQPQESSAQTPPPQQQATPAPPPETPTPPLQDDSSLDLPENVHVDEHGNVAIKSIDYTQAKLIVGSLLKKFKGVAVFIDDNEMKFIPHKEQDEKLLIFKDTTKGLDTIQKILTGQQPNDPAPKGSANTQPEASPPQEEVEDVPDSDVEVVHEPEAPTPPPQDSPPSQEAPSGASQDNPDQVKEIQLPEPDELTFMQNSMLDARLVNESPAGTVELTRIQDTSEAYVFSYIFAKYTASILFQVLKCEGTNVMSIGKDKIRIVPRMKDDNILDKESTAKEDANLIFTKLKDALSGDVDLKTGKNLPEVKEKPPPGEPEKKKKPKKKVIEKEKAKKILKRLKKVA